MRIGLVNSDITVVILGRSSGLPSGLLDALVDSFIEDGASKQRFDLTYSEIGQRLNSSMRHPFLKWMADRAGPRTGIRRLCSSATAAMFPRWWPAIIMRLGRKIVPAHALRRHLRKIDASGKRVLLVSHSAGGILGATVENERAVIGHISFGYPFKNPERPDEPYRTRSLPSIRKPFLIVQGDHDKYGTAIDAKHYPLSDHITLTSINSDHDYNNFTEDTVEKIREAARPMLVGGAALASAAQSDQQEGRDPILPLPLFVREMSFGAISRKVL